MTYVMKKAITINAKKQNATIISSDPLSSLLFVSVTVSCEEEQLILITLAEVLQ